MVRPWICGVPQRPGQPAGGVGAGAAVRDDLGQHRVVVRAHRRPVAEPGVHPQAGSGRDREAVQRAGDGQEPGRDVLGVQADLDGVAGDRGLADLGRQRLALGDAQLELDQVQAGDFLGDRVLDLQPGVHLQEVERPVAVQDELDGARAGVAGRPAGGDRCLGERGAKLAVDGRGRGLLHDLLVAALDGALALEQVDHVAVGVAEDLHLDVARVRDVALQEHGAVAERGGRLAARGTDRAGELRGVADQPHAAPAAAERRLDQQREADLRGRVMLAVRVDGHAGQHRDARRGHHGLGRDFVTHRLDRAGDGPTKIRPASAQARANAAFSDRNP